MTKKVQQIDLFEKVVTHAIHKRKRRCIVCQSETRFMFYCSTFCRKLYEKYPANR